MASEACATGKPVYIADIEPESGRLAAFHEGLRRTGHTRRFAGRVDAWSHPPLDEAPRIGEILRRRLAATGRLRGCGGAYRHPATGRAPCRERGCQYV